LKKLDNEKKEIKMKMKLRVLIPVLIFLLSFIIGCSNSGSKSNNKEQKLPIKIDTVKTGNIRWIEKVYGNIKGEREVDVYPKVPGKISKILRNEGEAVKIGDNIAIIDRDLTGMKYEPYPVDTPIPGFIVKIYEDEGNVVTPPSMGKTMGTPIALISEIYRVKILAEVYERLLAHLKTGTPAEIRVPAYPDKVFKGSVKRLSPMINPETRTSTAEIWIDNKDLMLKSGMFAEVSLILEEKNNVVLLPVDYIVIREDQKVVFVEKDGRVSKRAIRLGLQEGLLCEIVNGLSPGERVVAVGQDILKDGDSVNIIGVIE